MFHIILLHKKAKGIHFKYFSLKYKDIRTELTNIMKHIKIILLLLLTCQTYSQENDLNQNSEDFDNIFGDEDITIRRLSKFDALSILTAIKFPSALSAHLYRKICPFADRSIYSLPSLLLYHSEHVPSIECYNNLFRFNIFFNQMKKSSFGKTYHCGEYLCFDDNPIFLLDENVHEQMKLNNFLDMIEVAKKGKISLRKIGMYFQYLHNFNDKLSLEIDLPLYYIERNYYLNNSEIRAMEICSEKAGLPKPSADRARHEKDMTKKAVSDKFGFGNLTLKVGWLASDYFCNPLKIGLLLHVPTNTALKKEIIGTHFKNDLTTPKIDLFKLMCLGQQDPEAGGDVKKAEQLAIKIIHQTANRLSTILLDSDLGFPHFSIGFFADNYIYLNQNTAFRWLLNCDYQIPKKEIRFISLGKNKTDFEIEKFEKVLQEYETNTNSTTAEEKIDACFSFLNKHLSSTITPEPIYARIHPGFTVQFTAGPQINYQNWQFNLGYDYWYNAKEKISSLCSSNPNDYDICKSTRGDCYQLRIFGEIRQEQQHSCYCTSFGLHGDAVVLAGQIGKDFTVALDLQILF
jgi:hypothetical protein